MWLVTQGHLAGFGEASPMTVEWATWCQVDHLHPKYGEQQQGPRQSELANALRWGPRLG